MEEKTINQDGSLLEYVGEYVDAFATGEFVAPPDMDKECVELCTKLNKLSHVQTLESCCGHLKEPYLIFFKCDDFVRLGKLFRCVNRNYSDGKWVIEVDGGDMHPIYEFLLRSKEPFASYEEMQESIDGLIENIDYWEDSKFDEYFNNNGGRD